MNESEKVEQLEEKGRQIFENYCNQQEWCTIIRWSKKRFSPWDVSFSSGNTKGYSVEIIGEIKVRSYESQAFGDWYLEHDKLIALKEIRENYINKKIMYINIFTDDKLRAWDLDMPSMKDKVIKKKMMPKNEYNDTTMVQKDVYSLFNREAILDSEIDSLEKTLLNNIKPNIDEDDELPW